MQHYASMVSKRGFVLGWQIANLGNSLSCIANLFAFTARTGIPSVYHNPEALDGVFDASSESLAIIDQENALDRLALGQFRTDVSSRIKGTKAISDYPITLEQLRQFDDARAMIVWLNFNPEKKRVCEWRDAGREGTISRFCGAGNGVILIDVYWVQYKDMRTLSQEGPALRQHFGPLCSDRNNARRARMADEKRDGTLRIGLHLRRSDYKLWRGGQFYFSGEEYQKVIDTIRSRLVGRRHTIYVFGTELDGIDLEGNDVVVSHDDYKADFIALSSCDFCVGPPSTFGTWAAFLGNAGRVVLTRERVAGPAFDFLSAAVPVIYPTGAYLPGDITAGPD